jgi:hypothetical protein
LRELYESSRTYGTSLTFLYIVTPVERRWSEEVIDLESAKAAHSALIGIAMLRCLSKLNLIFSFKSTRAFVGQGYWGWPLTTWSAIGIMKGEDGSRA